MKKIITTLLILSAIYTTAFAQTRNATEFGVNIGLNSSTIQYSGTGQNSDYKDGANFGVSLEHYFSDRWSFKVKAIYDQKGWGNGFLVLADGTQIDGVDYHLNYITVPLMANWHFGRMRNWYLDFGPYVGFLASASETSNSADVKPLFNSTDVGIAFGIGVKIPVSNQVKLILEYDGQGGLTNVFTQSDGTYQNIRSSLNVGFVFPIK
ncbi:MAG TPA: porin family protein [Mucilaginibacter sp.]|nr:porin family protein [Mucilaginibacter sp.]